MSGGDILLRAFALAGCGTCRTLEDIRQKLKEEGFEQVNAYLAGSVAKQLRTALKVRHANGAAEAE